MTTGIESSPHAAQPEPLFILSFAAGGELSNVAENAGWRAHAARNADDVEGRYLASGASVAVVDARGAFEDGLAALIGLADVVEANAGALLMLLSRDDLAALDMVHARGATHYLASPFGDDELAQALRFAARHSERLAGDVRPRARRFHEPASEEPREGRGRRDTLTGLSDGGAARRWIAAAIARDQPVTLILLAIARFDIINTAFDAATGDELLRAAGRRIESLVREAGGREALVARIAGAEFAIGLDRDVGPDQARLISEELARSLARPFVIGEHIVPLACRIGLAASEAGDDAAALLRRASGALAEAKASESSAVRTMSSESATAAALGNRLEVDLRRALDQGEIEIVFQPQVAVTTRAIMGVEALARWRHPDAGLIGASTLFGAAERSGYLVPLSSHIQRRALEIAAMWPPSLSGLRLSINVTAADIAEPAFAERFLAAVDESGFPRDRLTVEITESGLIGDLGRAAAILDALRAGGCRVAIDDFGTGYSSLAYLKALPLDYLKIDKKLAEDIEGSSRDRVVVHGVIEMARSLGLGVVAEGVESEAQLAALAREGCNYYQGFLCSEAVGTAELMRLLPAAATG